MMWSASTPRSSIWWYQCSARSTRPPRSQAVMRLLKVMVLGLHSSSLSEAASISKKVRSASCHRPAALQAEISAE